MRVLTRPAAGHPTQLRTPRRGMLGRQRRAHASRAGLLSVLVALGGCVISTASASADLTHPFASSFGPGGPGSGEFSKVQGVAVDQSSGDVYVYDQGEEGRIYKFSSAGKPEPFSKSGKNVITNVGTSGTAETEIAVSSSGNTAGDIFVARGEADAKKIGIYSAESGELLGELGSEGAQGEGGEPCGVAVDPAGDLYVGLNNGHVDKYVSAAKVVATTDYTSALSGVNASGESCTIAVDNEGSAYVDTYKNGPVTKYEASQFSPGLVEVSAVGTEIVPQGTSSTLAVDPAASTHLLYVDERNLVAEYESSGGLRRIGVSGGSGPGALNGESFGVAVDGTSGTLYASNGAGLVGIYGSPPVVVPGVVTEAASGVTKTTAILNGTANPSGLAVSACQFEYKTEVETTYAHSIACKPTAAEIGTGTSPVAVTAELSGLTPQTSYSYRLSATNVNGTSSEQQETFLTEPAVDALSTGAAEAITPTEATLGGSLSPDGTDAHYYFEYGTSTAYGSVSPALPGTDAGTGGAECKPPGGPKCSPTAASTKLTGLTANTGYHYRLVAVNSFGTTRGEDATFTTTGPPRIEAESPEGITHTTATVKATINPDGFDTQYHVEYGESTNYGAETPEVNIGSGETPVPVSAELTKLKIGITYHYRFVATNTAGPPVEEPDQTFTTVPPALIDSEAATEVTATSAKLQTDINPLGNDTHAYFRYGAEAELAGTCEEYPASCVPSPPGIDAGTGETDVPGDVELQHLAPNTTYHYRVVVTNTLGNYDGAEHAFTTQAAGTTVALPDNREYELVSPPNMEGAQVYATGDSFGPDGGIMQASESGDAVTYLTNEPPISNAPANSNGSQILATRGSEFWSSQDIATPLSTAGLISGGPPGTEFKAFSSNLSSAVVQPLGPPELPLAPAQLQTWGLYKRVALTNAYTSLLPTPMSASLNGSTTLMDATPDLSHIVLTSPLALANEGINGLKNLYVWSEGQLQLVSVRPNSEATSAEFGYASEDIVHAISTDGSRIIWTGRGEEGTEHLYDRNIITHETVALDADGGPESGGGEFLIASSNGTRIFLTSPLGKLTNDANGGFNLYRYDFSKPFAARLTNLTPDPGEAGGAQVQGVLGASEDGSYVYFTADGVLSNAPNTQGEKALPAECSKATHGATCNLYVWHDNGTPKGSIMFITALSSEDAASWQRYRLGDLTARVSPSGRYLAFMSTADLTDYDNVDSKSSGTQPQYDAEVYIYDANSQILRCASCNTTGIRPTGRQDNGQLAIDPTGAWSGKAVAAMIPGWMPANSSNPGIEQPRYLSDEGRLFFDSTEALVPHDTDGHVDVYEYEPEGVGSCRTATGCISLISSGTGNTDSIFVDASLNGNDVFFTTTEQLTPAATNETREIYDAHVCNEARPCFTAPLAPIPACTSGDACRPSTSQQPITFGPPPSAIFSGLGNVPSTGTHISSKPLSRAQKFAMALRVCKKRHERMRAKCESRVRRRYDVEHKPTKVARRRK